MLEGCEEFTSLIQQMRNSRKLFDKIRGESWKFRCQQLRFARSGGRKYKETCPNPDAPKTKYACIVEANESTRKRLEGTLQKDHEDHIAGKGINSLNHYNLVHNKKSRCVSSGGQRVGKTRENTSITADESQKPKRGDR